MPGAASTSGASGAAAVCPRGGRELPGLGLRGPRGALLARGSRQLGSGTRGRDLFGGATSDPSPAAGVKSGLSLPSTGG
eukprot:3484281-Pyramimonas_sp.AAC.1